MGKLLSIAFIFLTTFSFSQKSAYIPLYLQDTTSIDGSQFTWSKTAESDNFTLIWGNTVGTDPATYSDSTLAFEPAVILDTLEAIYRAYKDFGFANDSVGTNLSVYKIPVIMYNTWGATGAEGYANGGDADGVIGAFWVHPIAMHGGHVAAHELTHSLQAQTTIDYRASHSLGPVWNNAGIFWETHANFMRNLLYPTDVTAWGMDVYHIETWGDWKNTYENYELLMAIMESDGIDMVNRLWRESYSNEYPLQTYKRLSHFTQEQFNEKMFEYARRMATFDFSYHGLGAYFRQYHSNDQLNYLPSVQAAYTILKQDSLVTTHYQVPIELAPEESAYNIIPIYPDPDSCSVIVKFKGHTDANPHTGWRYGFVAAKTDGTLGRYGTTYSENTNEIAFSLLPGETSMYLIIMGAPADDITTNASNDTWHGYPKHFRFPYELTISGGKPEGFQAGSDFRSRLKVSGHLHSNGNGWIDNTASVASTVYVAPNAMVLGSSAITGNVSIQNTALVKDATISGNVIVKENAFIIGGTYSDHAVIKGQSYAENNTMSGNGMMDMRAKVSNYSLSGTVEVGGDVVVYNDTGNCDNGVYYRMTNYYEDNLLECDGRTAMHPANSDVNNTFSPFSMSQMNMLCNCASFPDCLTTGVLQRTVIEKAVTIYPNPTTGMFQLSMDNRQLQLNNVKLSIYNVMGEKVCSRDGKQLTDSTSIDLSDEPNGIYFMQLKTENNVITKKIIINK